MKRIMLLGLACVALAGCSQGVWVKPGSTQADFNRDRVACQYDADKAAAPAMATNGFLSGYQSATLAKECMEAHGYALTNKTNVPAAAEVAMIRAPGQTLDQLKALDKACASASASKPEDLECLKRNHVTVMPQSEWLKYVQKALASGAIKKQDLKNGTPVTDADMLAVDKLVWSDFNIQ